MRYQKVINLILILLAVITIYILTQRNENPYMVIPYAVDNEISRNVTVMIDVDHWNQNFLRLRFIPKNQSVHITGLKIYYEKQLFEEMSDLEDTLDIALGDERILLENKPFEHTGLNPTNLVVGEIQGTLK